MTAAPTQPKIKPFSFNTPCSFDPAMAALAANPSIPYDDRAEALDEFHWECTPQGHDYWDHQQDRLLDEKPLDPEATVYLLWLSKQTPE